MVSRMFIFYHESSTFYDSLTLDDSLFYDKQMLNICFYVESSFQFVEH